MKMKKLDYVIIGILIVITLASSAAAIISSNRKFDEVYVNIEVEGKQYKKIPLRNHTETLKIKTDLGTNIIEINDGKVHVADADCPDKICVKDGYISKPGQILVCLPHKVVIQVTGQKGHEVDDTAY